MISIVLAGNYNEYLEWRGKSMTGYAYVGQMTGLHGLYGHVDIYYVGSWFNVWKSKLDELTHRVSMLTSYHPFYSATQVEKLLETGQLTAARAAILFKMEVNVASGVIQASKELVSSKSKKLVMNGSSQVLKLEPLKFNYDWKVDYDAFLPWLKQPQPDTRRELARAKARACLPLANDSIINIVTTATRIMIEYTLDPSDAAEICDILMTPAEQPERPLFRKLKAVVTQ